MGKRGNGRGSVTARGSKTWRVQLTVEGRRLSETVHGTKTQALARLDELNVAASRGQLSAGRETVGFLLDEWLAAAKLSPTTRADYRRVVDRYLKPGLGKVEVAKLRPRSVDAFYASLTCSQWRVRRCHEVLSRALAQAVKWGMVAVNVCRDASPPGRPGTRLSVPLPDAVAGILAKADGEFALFLRLAAVTGARRGELCGLQWSDIDGETVRIRRSIAYTPASGVVIKATKTGRERKVHIDVETARQLSSLRVSRGEAALACGIRVKEDTFIFTRDPEGKVPWRPDWVTHRFVALAGGTCRLHDLRHFAATQMLVNGIDPRTAADRLGHAQVSTFLNVYTHATPARDRDAADLLAAIVHSNHARASRRD